MGVFYYVGAVALAEDIPEVELHEGNLKQFYSDMDKGFQQVNYDNNFGFLLSRVFHEYY